MASRARTPSWSPRSNRSEASWVTGCGNAAVACLLAVTTGCVSHQVNPAGARVVHAVAVLALDGEVGLDFGDEPPRTNHGLFGHPRSPPAPEVTKRRTVEAEAVLAHAQEVLARRMGWRVVRPGATQSEAWARLLQDTGPSPVDSETLRQLHPQGLASTRSLTNAFDGGAPEPSRGTEAPGQCQVEHDPFALGRSPAVRPLEQLARELDVQAFVVGRMVVDRNAQSTHGPIIVNHFAEPDAPGRLAPVARVSLLVVDACGHTIALVEHQAAARHCTVSVHSENADDETCAIVDAASLAIDGAIEKIASGTP